jgi:hypothetical protein
VADIFSAGGFCLTDYRPRLSEVSLYANLFSFASHYELLEKMEFFMSDKGEKLMDDLGPELTREFRETCSYEQLVEAIEENVSKYSRI